MKRKIINSTIVLLIALLASPVFAEEIKTAKETQVEEVIHEKIEEVIEKHKLKKQEFKPIIFDENTNSKKIGKEIHLDSNKKTKNIKFKNEFFKSIKVLLSANGVIADEKIVYLNPYEELDNVVIQKKLDYNIKIFDIDDNYLGNLVRTDLKKVSSVKISPFLVYPELKKVETKLVEKKENPKPKIISHKTTKTTKTETTTVITEKNDSTPQPKVIEQKKKLNDLKPEPIEKTLEKNNNDNLFKIANISDYRIKVLIKKADGENIGTSWIIDNDSYIPEALEFASKPVVLEPDTKVTILYLDGENKTKREIQLLAKDIKKDGNNNYTYFAQNID